MFPIDLSNSDEAIFLCDWNSHEIVELHTKQSLKAKYGSTNLFDDEEFKWQFDLDMGFAEYLDYMSSGAYRHFDNLRIERIN
jgi:protein involved in temperature-dependent protein secretion